MIAKSMKIFLTFVLMMALICYVALPAVADTDLPAEVAQVTDSDTPSKPGYLLTASDEFNNDDVNHGLFSDRYLEHWSVSPGTKAKYEVSDGTLKLKILPDQQPWDPIFDSDTKVSSLQTYEKDYIHKWTDYKDIAQSVPPFRGFIQKYGYFEIRAKAALGGGVHSAWWMTGVNQDQPEGKHAKSRETGEVDIFEILGRNNATAAQTAIHPWGDWPNLWPYTSRFDDGKTNLAEKFHVYGFEWDEKFIKVYMDGKLVLTKEASPNYPMMTYLGVYEKQNSSSWTGPFDNSVPYPKTFEIDYFRAYQRIPKSLSKKYKLCDGVMRGKSICVKGETVRWIGLDRNDVTLPHVYAPTDGEYWLKLQYRSEEHRDLSVDVNGQPVAELTNLASGSFSGQPASIEFLTHLKAGWNSVRFYNQQDYAPDLTQLTVLRKR